MLSRNQKKFFLLVLLMSVFFAYQNCGNIKLQSPSSPLSSKVAASCFHGGQEYESNPEVLQTFYNDDIVCQNLSESYAQANFSCFDGSWKNSTGQSIEIFPFGSVTELDTCDPTNLPESCSSIPEFTCEAWSSWVAGAGGCQQRSRICNRDLPAACTELLSTKTETQTDCPAVVNIPGTNAEAMVCQDVERNPDTEHYHQYLESLGNEPPMPAECLGAVPWDLANGTVSLQADVSNHARNAQVSVESYIAAAVRLNYDLNSVRRNRTFNNAYGSCGGVTDTGFGRTEGFSKNEFVAMRFKTGSNEGGSFDFSLNSAWTPHEKANVLYTISKCPGDFGSISFDGSRRIRALQVDSQKISNTSGMLMRDATSTIQLDRCIAESTYAGTMAFTWSTTDSSASGCKLEPNQTYYLNVVYRDALMNSPNCRKIDIQKMASGQDIGRALGENCSIEYMSHRSKWPSQ